MLLMRQMMIFLATGILMAPMIILFQVMILMGQ